MLMRWESLLNPERLGSKRRHDDLARSPFHKDHDRIIFSGAFRHLNRKTQVHPFSQNDQVHTRLTHSLEVGCVGRSLGQLVGEQLGRQLPQGIGAADIGAIIQAACLAHDIGNPPFGHAGEYAIRDWFMQSERQWLRQHMPSEEVHDLCNFEGNAQGLRILTQTEYHPFQGGMRLTFSTLGAYLKYPWIGQAPANLSQPSHQAPKYGCYYAERHLLAEIADRLGLIRQGEFRWCRHPLAYLVEAADDICYALIDLEDGIEMDILPYAEVESIFLRLLGDRPLPTELSRPGASERQKIAALRGAVFEVVVTAVANAFIAQQEALLSGELSTELLKHCDRHISDGIDHAKQLARKKIFSNPRKAQIELGAYATLGILLNAFCEAALADLEGRALSFKHRRLLDLLTSQQPHPVQNHYQACMRVLDFVASLSDNHAQQLAQNLSGSIQTDLLS